MERREIATLPIAPGVKSRLNTAGYRCVQDFIDTDSKSLSKETGLTNEDAEIVLQIIERSKAGVVKARDGMRLYKDEVNAATITTFSEQLDTALGGGVQCGTVTEVCGLPGHGKTQLCMQLCCDVQIPGVFGGLDGEVLYIDTDGGLVPDRMMDIVAATVKHCHFMAHRHTEEEVVKALCEVTVDKMLAGIHIQKCTKTTQLLVMINTLPDFITNHSKVKLVIIDSISFHLRHEFEDMSQRTRILTNLAQTLVTLATTFNIAVLLTNQMTTKVHQGPEKGSHVVPSLGESWGHACTTRIILQCVQGTRHAWLYKSPHVKQTRVPFQVTTDGIRDTVPPPVSVAPPLVHTAGIQDTDTLLTPVISHTLHTMDASNYTSQPEKRRKTEQF